MRNLRMLVMVVVALMLSGLAGNILAAESIDLVDSSECLGCHDQLVSKDAFVHSTHGGNGCTSCHLAGMQLDKHMEGEVQLEDVRCERCHTKETSEHVESVHFANDVTCIS